MGEESRPTEAVEYMLNGQPVGPCGEIPSMAELAPAAPDTPAACGAITAEKLARITETITAAFDALAPAFEQLARSLRKITAIIMLDYKIQWAVKWAEVYNPKLAHFYHHTKKRRIRKKYAKRILAWYRKEAAW